jgi:hypothetical protein
LKRNDDTLQPYSSSFYDADNQQARARHELLSKISLEPNILKVLHIAGSWWLPWRNLWPPLLDGDEKLNLVHFVHDCLAQKNPINVASGLICIAICLQQMRPGADDYDIPFSAPPNELASNILTAVDQLALADEDNLASLDGLEALVLRAKSYVNASNQPRKCWSSIRRAIAVAQLIDLPRAGLSHETVETIRRQRFMGALFETDRFMSLLMGLPYAVDDQFNDRVANQVLHSPTDIKTQMRALRRVVALAAGKVNDRNTSTSEAKESAMKLIQQTLDDAARKLPCEWWNVENHSNISNDAQSSHEHLLTQLWFYQVQSFLHLPLMLKPASDRRFERSRLVCLSSSRKLLRVYQVLRQPHLAPYTSKCVDFQALIAAVLVLLGLLQYGWQDRRRANAGYEEDVDLINTTRQVFEVSSMEQGGSIARQGVHMIDSLGAFVGDGKRSDFIRTATLFVPYFGTISVQSGRDNSTTSATTGRTDSTSYSDRSSSSQNESQQLPENPASSTSYYTTMPAMARPPNAQPDALLLNQSIETYVHAITRSHASTTTAATSAITALDSSLGGPPLSLPLTTLPTFDHIISDTSLTYNADAVKSGYDVPTGWQRMMVGAGLDVDCDCNGGVGSGGATAQVV